MDKSKKAEENQKGEKETEEKKAGTTRGTTDPSKPMILTLTPSSGNKQKVGEGVATVYIRSKEDSPFARRESLKRTPPGLRERSWSLPDHVTTENPGQKEGQQREVVDEASPPPDQFLLKKRKRDVNNMALERGSPSMESLYQAVKKVTTEIGHLQALVKVNDNTKCEIKKKISDLGYYGLQLEKVYERVVNESKPKTTVDVTVQTETTSKGANMQPEMKEAGMQTDIPMAKVRSAKIAEEISTAIREGNSFEDYKELVEKDWPAQVFERVEEAEGNPLWETEERDLGLCILGSEELDKGIGKQFKMRFPEIAELDNDSPGKEGVMYIKYETSLTVASKKSEVKERYLFRIIMDSSEEKTFVNLIKWKQSLVNNGRTRVALPRTECNWKRIKKMIEFVMSGTDIKVISYYPPGKRGEKQEEETARREVGTAEKGKGRVQTRGRKDRQVLFLKQEGVEYRDLLTKIKKVDIKTLGTEITALRKTRKGEMLIEVKGGKDAILPLQNEIEKLGISIRAKGAGKMVVVKDLDAAITSDEVRKSIAEEMNITEEEVVVERLRPSFGENQTAMVRLPAKEAMELLEKKRMRIGWVKCRIMERIIDTGADKKCYRCWGYGHTRDNCTGVDRSKICLRCGEENHQVKECTGLTFCPICKKGGHRADSKTCPWFRKALGGSEQEGGGEKASRST